MCDTCRRRLARFGCVNNLGHDIRQGLQPAGGECGIVHLTPQVYPPPQKKVAGVILKGWASEPPPVNGKRIKLPYNLKIRNSQLPKAGCKKRWRDVEPGDLRRLERVVAADRPIGRVVGPVISGCPAIITAKTDAVAVAAVACRMFRRPPPPKGGVWSFASTLLSSIVPEYSSPPPEMGLDEWLQSMPSHRRAALTIARDAWLKYGWSDKYKDFHSFIKEEFLPGFDKDSSGIIPLRTLVARLINAPHDVTHVIAGPKIKPYLTWLKQQWNYQTGLFYASTSPDKIQAWLARATSGPYSIVFWSDYSMFDSSHNEETWQLVESFYSQHGHDRDFQRVLRAWRAPSGTIGNLKYTGRVMNASGRDDTALANAILNGVAMMLSVSSAWCAVPLRSTTRAHIERTTSELMLSVCGDDALGFMPDVSEERMLNFRDTCKKNLVDFGFDAKFYISRRFEDAVYLGHRPYLVGGMWYWGKTLGRCLYKLGYQRGIAGDARAYFKGICAMHRVCSAHVPILSDITEAYMARTTGAKVNPYVTDPNRPWEEMGKFGPGYYDYTTVCSVARAYTTGKQPGREAVDPNDVLITPQDIYELRDYVREHVRGSPCVLDHWLLRHMVWVDEL